MIKQRISETGCAGAPRTGPSRSGKMDSQIVLDKSLETPVLKNWREEHSHLPAKGRVPCSHGAGGGGAWLPRPRSGGPKWGVSSPGTPPAGTGQLQRVGLAKPAVGGPVGRLEVEEAGATWDLEPRGSRGGDPDRRPPQGGGAESQPPSPWKLRGDMFTGLKEKSCHPRILYPAKVSFKS